MLIIALVGLFINIIVAWIMLRGAMRRKLKYGAYLHVISDMLGSIGAVIAALLIIFLDGVGGSFSKCDCSNFSTT